MPFGPRRYALVVFDAFDTLLQPTKAPALQYADVARQHGLAVTDGEVSRNFQAAFKRVAREHPNYGLRTSLASPDEWWRLVIRGTFGARSTRALEDALLHRFSTTQAYRLFPDVERVLPLLARRTRLALATNSDARILPVLAALGVGPYLPLHTATLSYTVGHEKPHPLLFLAAARASHAHPHHTLYVGDQLGQDYHAARAAGLHAVWLRRDAPQHQPPTDHVQYDEHDPELRERTISSLTQLLDLVV